MPFIPLTSYIPTQYLPAFFHGLVNNIVFSNEEFDLTYTGWELVLTLAYRDGSAIDTITLPAIDSDIFAIQLTNLTTLRITKSFEEYGLRYNPTNIRFLLPNYFKNAVERTTNGKTFLEVASESKASINVALADKFIEYNSSSGLTFLDNQNNFIDPDINTAFFLGETGIGLKLQHATFNLNDEGVELKVKRARVYFPDSLPFIPDLEINDGIINHLGFTGELKFDWDLQCSDGVCKVGSQIVKLIGEYSGGLDFLEITFENNAIKACNITGEMFLPYFNPKTNPPLRVTIQINDFGAIKVGIQTTGGKDLSFTHDELVKLYLQSMELDQATNSFNISGGLEPLLFSKDGIKWPRMDVKNLRISSDGKISIDEAWLDLKDLVDLDLWGFHFELRKIGIGTTQDKKMWVDISGGVKLIEQLPLGLDVEGFRIAWPENLSFDNPDKLVENLQKIEIQFQGVEINFAIPAVVKIDGLIRFFKDAQKVGFAGDMKLAVIPAGFTAEAGLMVGMNLQNPPFPFMYVYFGFECTAGIPLAQTGLALKGAIGLIGMNVAPNKTTEQHWYYDWYKGPPANGVQQTTKWTDKNNAFAIGIGITISTVDGIVKKVSGLLVLAIPGPTLVINGKAFLLDTGTGSGEPPFEALAVLDGNEGTVLFNVRAQGEIAKDMLEATADVEAFFDFNDLTNWHLYLGANEPKNRRIRANIMDVLKADAYLMFDMIDADSPRIRAGISVNFEPEIPDLSVEVAGHEVGIEIDAWLNIEGDGEVSINPEQFSGRVHIDGGLTVDAFGFVFGPEVKANLNFEGPSPFLLEGDLDFTLRLDWPLEDFHGEAPFKLKIPSPPTLSIKDPLQSIALFSRFTNESNAIFPRENLPTDERSKAELSALVPVDVNPVIAFNHEMNDLPEMKFLMHPGGTKNYKIGKITLEPTIEKIEIYEKKKSGGWDSPWNKIYTTNIQDQIPILIGSWLAETDPQSPGVPASRKLLLLTDNPLINTAHTYTMEGGFLLAEYVPTLHPSQLLLQDYPGLMVKANPVTKRCINFMVEDGLVITSNAGEQLNFASLVFKSNGKIEIGCLDVNKVEDCYCLRSQKDLNIIFPAEVIECFITYCNPPDRQSEDGKPSEIEYIKVDIKNGKYNSVVKKDYKYLVDKTSIWHILPNKYDGEFSFNQITIKAGIFSIKEICYTTKNDFLNKKLNEETVEKNKDILNNSNLINPYLNPGCYYKIEVQNKIRGELTGSHDEGGMYSTALQSALPSSGHRKTFEQVTAYFQTDSPPNNLDPYIKWTYPNVEMNRVYCNDEFAICFNRDYLYLFFDGTADQLKSYKIDAFILDAQNNLIPYGTQWKKSSGYTLFPDEQTWEDHKQEFQLPVNNRKEDILIIKKPNDATPLKPNQKFSLILTGGDGGKLITSQQLEKSELAKVFDFDEATWNYSDAKVLNLKTNGLNNLITTKANFDNVEIAFESAGSDPFGIIFRYRKTSDGKEVFYKINFVRRPGSRPGIIDFQITDGLHSSRRQRMLLIDEYWPLEWRKFKIRIVGCYVKIFCFEKSLLPDRNGFDLRELLPLPNENFTIENNINGSIGLTAVNMRTKFRNIVIKNSELLRIPFYTTGFDSINAMIKPQNGNPKLTLTAAGEHYNQALQKINKDILEPLFERIETALFNFYIVQRDYNYGMAKYNFLDILIPPLYGREAVEKYRLEVREAQKSLDDLFYNEIALKLVPDVLFIKPDGGMSIYLVTQINDLKKTQVIAFYTKFSENLYPTLLGNNKDPFAKTTVEIKTGSTNLLRSFSSIFNSDGDQIIFKITPIDLSLEGEIKKKINFKFSINKNFNDDRSSDFLGNTDLNLHHRYDRPFITFNNSTENLQVKEDISFEIEI